MFKDALSTETVIQPEDTVYIYEYRQRKDIKGFSDLTKVTVDTVVTASKKDKNIIVRGHFENVDDDGRIFNDVMTGIVAYKANGPFVETKEGLKYISYYISSQGFPEVCLRKVKDHKDFYTLHATFGLTKELRVRAAAADGLLFNSVADAEDYIQYIDISNAELSNEYIRFDTNGVLNVFTNFDIIIGDHRFSSRDKLKEIFSFVCKQKNSKNNAQFDFNKVFSLRHLSFELDAAKLHYKF